MFDVDQLLADCVAANAESEPRLAMRDVLTRAMARPGEVADALAPTEGGLDLLLHTPELTVMHVVWAPRMHRYPHDHRMWAAIAVYGGQEDNAFYRRSGPGERTLAATGGRELVTGDVALLGHDTIHAVTNPLGHLTGAIHVYGGDFVNQPRSQWGPGPELERDYDADAAHREFAEANEAWRRAAGAGGGPGGR
jgi:predicted metal-dependent enzyme (double-stranded beta helix superfamily)